MAAIFDLEVLLSSVLNCSNSANLIALFFSSGDKFLPVIVPAGGLPEGGV